MTDELIQTFIEEYQGAKDELDKVRYKNSAILFAKALFAICDIIIRNKISKWIIRTKLTPSRPEIH